MTSTLTPGKQSHRQTAADRLDWKRIAYLVLASRGLDDTEEQKLMPEKKVVYQFSARGHELAQIILGSMLDGEHDAAGAYYRSRPLLLTLGLSLETPSPDR
jgi:2-oxoisovalerate dehydrogenase E1 component